MDWSSYLAFFGLLSAILTGALAVGGKIHKDRDKDGSLTRAGRVAALGTAVMAVMSVTLFVAQWRSDVVSRAKEQKRQDTLLQLIAFNTLPSVRTISGIIAYPDDSRLHAFRTRLVKYFESRDTDGCTAPPSFQRIDKRVFFFQFQPVAGGGYRAQDFDKFSCWSDVGKIANYFGYLQGSIAFYAPPSASGGQGKRIAVLSLQPWSQGWTDGRIRLAFNLETSQFEMHLISAPPNTPSTATDTGSYSLIAMLGGQIAFRLGPSLGGRDSEEKELGQRLSSQRAIVQLTLRLLNDAAINLTNWKSTQKDGGIDATIDIPSDLVTFFEKVFPVSGGRLSQ